MQTLLDFVRDLGLDAYLVGGAVRDELLGLPVKDADFLVPRVDHAGLRAALEPHGRVDDLEVNGQLVGARLYPRDREIRALAPRGIEFAPPRAERSTGRIRSPRYAVLVSGCTSIPSATRPAAVIIRSPTAASETGGLPYGFTPGLKNSVIRVCR